MMPIHAGGCGVLKINHHYKNTEDKEGQERQGRELGIRNVSFWSSVVEVGRFGRKKICEGTVRNRKTHNSMLFRSWPASRESNNSVLSG